MYVYILDDTSALFLLTMEIIDRKPTDVKKKNRAVSVSGLVKGHLFYNLRVKRGGGMLPCLTSAGICCTVRFYEWPGKQLRVPRLKSRINVSEQAYLWIMRISWAAHFLTTFSFPEMPSVYLGGQL